MNASVLLSWAVVAVLAAISVILLMGKGGFLIAGYNTASKKAKQKYNVKRLCRVMGGGVGVLSVILGIAVFFNFENDFVTPWLFPIGFWVVVAVTAILANTICYEA